MILFTEPGSNGELTDRLPVSDDREDYCRPDRQGRTCCRWTSPEPGRSRVQDDSRRVLRTGLVLAHLHLLLNVELDVGIDGEFERRAVDGRLLVTPTARNHSAVGCRGRRSGNRRYRQASNPSSASRPSESVPVPARSRRRCSRRVTRPDTSRMSCRSRPTCRKLSEISAATAGSTSAREIDETSRRSRAFRRTSFSGAAEPSALCTALRDARRVLVGGGRRRILLAGFFQFFADAHRLESERFRFHREGDRIAVPVADRPARRRIDETGRPLVCGLRRQGRRLEHLDHSNCMATAARAKNMTPAPIRCRNVEARCRNRRRTGALPGASGSAARAGVARPRRYTARGGASRHRRPSSGSAGPPGASSLRLAARRPRVGASRSQAPIVPPPRRGPVIRELRRGGLLVGGARTGVAGQRVRTARPRRRLSPTSDRGAGLSTPALPDRGACPRASVLGRALLSGAGGAPCAGTGSPTTLTDPSSATTIRATCVRESCRASRLPPQVRVRSCRPRRRAGVLLVAERETRCGPGRCSVDRSPPRRRW